MFDNRYLKTKIKPYKNKITTNFLGEVPKEGSKCICLSVIGIDSVLKLGKNYYPQTFLEECEYKIKEKKVYTFLDDDVGISFDKDFEEEGFEENFEQFMAL